MKKNQLKFRREQLKKTQREVAMENHIPERAYQRYEHGTVQPAVWQAICIAKSLGTTVEELWK